MTTVSHLRAVPPSSVPTLVPAPATNVRPLRPIGQEGMPAHDLLAEGTLLCALLLGAAHVDDVRAYLKPEHFFDRNHAFVYEAMLDAHAAGLVVDGTTVANRLRQKDRLVGMGGAAFLGRLVDENPTDGAVLSYAQIILDCWVIRQSERLAERVAKAARRPVANVEDFMAKWVREVEKIADVRRVGGQTDLGSGLLADMREREAIAQRGHAVRCPTGFAQLDAIMRGGWPETWITVLGAESETGKTAFAVHSALTCAETPVEQGGGTVLVISAELTRKQMDDRFVCNLSGLPFYQLEALSAPETVAKAMAYLFGLPIHIDPQTRMDRIKASVRQHARLAEAKGSRLRLVVVDYLQLVRLESPPDSREQEIAEAMEAFKDLRAEFPSAAFLILSQLNGQGALRGSGAIKHVVDQTLFLTRPDKDDKTNVHLTFGKGRGVGNTAAYLPFVVEPEAGRIEEARS